MFCFKSPTLNKQSQHNIYQILIIW